MKPVSNNCLRAFRDKQDLIEITQFTNEKIVSMVILLLFFNQNILLILRLKLKR